MTTTLAITYEPDPPAGDVAAVRAGLSAYNRARAPDDTYHPFALFVRDAQGAAAGGLLGGFIWEWLYVEILWLRPELRAQGYGSRLLAGAERLAGERGCFSAYSWTR